MRYMYVISVLCLYSTVSLYANEDKLGNILQQSGEEKVLLKPVEKKKKSKKQSRFVFKDEYHSNGIGEMDKTASKGKSESYDYENRSRFKFKFNDGYQQSNLLNGYGAAAMGGTGSMGSGGFGNGGGGKGRR
jgi:hypothetical protein